MKKIVAMLLAMLLCISMTACGDDTPEDSSGDKPKVEKEVETPTKSPVQPEKIPEPTPIPEKVLTGNPLIDSDFKTAPVKSGSGSNIGTYGYINISKSELKNISNEAFIAFVNERVYASGYNWVSIICNDGTGICFAGSMKEIGTYGKIDIDGTISTVVGNILLDNGAYTYSPS